MLFTLARGLALAIDQDFVALWQKVEVIEVQYFGLWGLIPSLKQPPGIVVWPGHSIETLYNICSSWGIGFKQIVLDYLETSLGGEADGRDRLEVLSLLAG
jgi:hypothetical protein